MVIIIIYNFWIPEKVFVIMKDKKKSNIFFLSSPYYTNWTWVIK